MSTVSDTTREYPVFKGLQRPLEFMGLQGRYIYWAAGTAGGGILGFIVGYIAVGFIVGLTICTVALGVGGVLVFVKQRQGLHSKHVDKGIFIYMRSHHR